MADVAAPALSSASLEAVMGGMSKGYALLAGLQLDLFTALDGGSRTVAELAAAVGGDAERLGGLLYYLASLELLTVQAGRFANTPLADRWLVRDRPDSFVDRAGLTAEIWAAAVQTAASVRTGHALGAHNYATLPRDQQLAVYQTLNASARASASWLAELVDFTRCATLVDVGGGGGGLAIALTERYPQLHATVAELPNVVPLTAQFVADAEASGRVGTLGVDLVASPLPGTYDVAVLSKLLQVLGREEVRRLLRHVAVALPPEGTLCILGFVSEDSRLGPEGALWFNFAAVSFYEQGQAYTEAEHRRWLAEAGFVDPTFHWGPPGQGCVVVARKGRAGGVG